MGRHKKIKPEDTEQAEEQPKPDTTEIEGSDEQPEEEIVVIQPNFSDKPYLTGGLLLNEDKKPRYFPEKRTNNALTPEVWGRILKMIAAGSYVEQSCKAAGISRNTFYRWKARAEEGEEPYAALFEDLEIAEAQAENAMLSKLENVGQTNWVKYVTQMERRWPQRWGRNDRMTVEKKENKSVTISLHVGNRRVIETWQDLEKLKADPNYAKQLPIAITDEKGYPGYIRPGEPGYDELAAKDTIRERTFDEDNNITKDQTIERVIDVEGKVIDEKITDNEEEN